MSKQTVKTQYADVHVCSGDDQQTKTVLDWLKDLGHPITLPVLCNGAG